MADYDVGVIGLTTPAPSAPLAKTRPVVSVRNNGLHDVIASGYIRIYSAGLLIFESEVYSDTIGPGETRPASSVDYWMPAAEGTYTVQGYVSCPLDQVEPNNNLFPTTITVSGTEPVPPTPVQPHASQHESGGEDEVSIEGLPGRAADDQHPIAHASDHENAGVDRLDVTGLPGILGEAQTAKPHAAAHKVGGSDPVDALALPNATNFELVARKGAANGYAGLNAGSFVPTDQLAPVGLQADTDGLRFDASWGPTTPIAHATTHEAGEDDELDVGGLPGVLDEPQKPQVNNATGAFVNVPFDAAETTIATITVPASWMNAALGVVMNIGARLTTAIGVGAVLRLKIKQAAAILVQHDVDVNKNSVAPASVHAFIAATDYLHVKAFLEFMADSDAVQHLGTHVATTTEATSISETETVFSVTAQFVNGAAADVLTVDMSHSWNTGQPS